MSAVRELTDLQTEDEFKARKLLVWIQIHEIKRILQKTPS